MNAQNNAQRAAVPVQPEPRWSRKGENGRMACLHGDLASRIDHFAESLKQAAPRAGRTRRTSRKADGPADTGDVVEFGVSHPDTCRIGVPFLIDVWVFRLGEREAVAGLAEKGAGEPVRF